MWFFQFGKKMVNRLKYMMEKKNEDITESEEERLQRELRAKEDQLNELIRENMRLNEMIENMETKCSTFISEREGIMQVEVGMYKDEFMENLKRETHSEIRRHGAMNQQSWWGISYTRLSPC